MSNNLHNKRKKNRSNNPQLESDLLGVSHGQQQNKRAYAPPPCAPPLSTGSGKRTISEMPTTSFSNKEQFQPIHKDRVAERRCLYGSSSSVGDDLSNSGYGNSSSTHEKQRRRGPTHMARVWIRKTRKEVQFNKFGQPIGPNKGEFVEFLGTIARNGSLAPLDTKSWLEMSETLKLAMLDLLKDKFVLAPGFKVWTLKNLGKKWRNWKNRVKKKYFDPNASLEQNLRKRPDSDDERIFPDQWKKLVIYWDSLKAREQSTLNKDHRAQKKMDHTTGKRSFAQVSDEMKNKAMVENERDGETEDESDDAIDYEPSRVELFGECYKNTSNPIVLESKRRMEELRSNLAHTTPDKGPNDILSQVLAEKSGRVLMFGFGVAPSDIHGPMPSRASCHRMNLEYKNDIEKLMKRNEEHDKKIDALLRMNLERGKTDSPSKVGGVPPPSSSDHSTSYQQRTSAINSMRPRVWSLVSLKSMLDPSKVVAIGRIESLDPSKQVGHVELGKNWCEVKVNVALELCEELIRPIQERKTIGEVVGIAIAWPLHLVVLMEDR